MKKLYKTLAAALMAALLLLACAAVPALAEMPAVATPEPSLSEAATFTEPAPAEPFTWQYLGTIAGAAAATLLIVQFLKAPLDSIWKIPTRVLVYAIALIIMLVATAVTGDLTPEAALLAAINAFVAAMTAMGAYEITFSKLDHAEIE